MTTQQLEIVFDPAPGFQPRVHRAPNLTRARWWFDRMHRTIAAALAGRRRPAPPPVQGYLDLRPSRSPSARPLARAA